MAPFTNVLSCSSQINIVLKLTHLPSLPSYSLDLCEFPLNYASQRFYMMQGIVIAMTTVTKYTQGARFLCSDEVCPFSKGQCSHEKWTHQAIPSQTIFTIGGYSKCSKLDMSVSPNVYKFTVRNLETVFPALHQWISVDILLKKDIPNETERIWELFAHAVSSLLKI